MIRDYKTLAGLMEPLLAPDQQTFNFGQINFRHKDLREGGRMVYSSRDADKA